MAGQEKAANRQLSLPPKARAAPRRPPQPAQCPSPAPTKDTAAKSTATLFSLLSLLSESLSGIHGTAPGSRRIGCESMDHEGDRDVFRDSHRRPRAQAALAGRKRPGDRTPLQEDVRRHVHERPAGCGLSPSPGVIGHLPPPNNNNLARQPSNWPNSLNPRLPRHRVVRHLPPRGHSDCGILAPPCSCCCCCRSSAPTTQHNTTQHNTIQHNTTGIVMQGVLFELVS